MSPQEPDPTQRNIGEVQQNHHEINLLIRNRTSVLLKYNTRLLLASKRRVIVI